MMMMMMMMMTTTMTTTMTTMMMMMTTIIEFVLYEVKGVKRYGALDLPVVIKQQIQTDDDDTKNGARS
jgi:hypothetical protein